MIAPNRIPISTVRQLANPANPGNRNSQIVEISTALTGSGLDPENAFALIRPNYGPDITDSEIDSVIDWAVNRVPDRSSLEPQIRSTNRYSAQNRPKSGVRSALIAPRFGSEPPRPPEPQIAVTRFLNGFNCEETDLWEASAIRLSEPFETDAVSAIASFYEPGELVNIVTAFRYSGKKANPVGFGETEKREIWLERLSEGRFGAEKAGAWIRPNPEDGTGISDRNVTAFRFLLVESNELPISLQIPFLAKLRLPISAVITSGGKSLHAWIRIDAETESDYRTTAKLIFDTLSPFGIDSANRNTCRLSRLPGVIREIGKDRDNRQRLLFLNPSPNQKGGIL
jgi:hypothetical protein